MPKSPKESKGLPAEDAVFALIEGVSDEASFLRFVRGLAALRQPVDVLGAESGVRDAWANHSISEFLLAAAAWAKDSKFGDRPGPAPKNDWQAFALFLWAGKSYE